MLAHEDPRNPELSVIIAIVSDTTNRQFDFSCLSGCLEAISQQIDPPLLEILVPYPSQARNFEIFEEQYPQAKFIPVDDLKTYQGTKYGREHHDELRARGISASRGEIVALLEDHARPDPNWCRQIVESHRQKYAVIGGAIENGIDRSINWAVYFCDFARYQNPVPQGETSFASDANISYKRNVLMSILPVWCQAFHETEVNWALHSRGEKLVLSSDIIVYQHRKSLKLGDALKERFIWGRSYAITRSKSLTLAKRVLYGILTPLLPVILLVRMTLNIIGKGRNIKPYLKAFPTIILLLIWWSIGEFSGYIKSRSA